MVNARASWCNSTGRKSQQHDNVLVQIWNVILLSLISFLHLVTPAERFSYGCYWDPTPERRVPWRYAAPWLPILVVHIRSQIKTRQSQSYKFKKLYQKLNPEILQETVHATQLLKLLGKMYKYEMDLTRTVGTTERTCDVGRMWDRRRTDGRMDRWMEWNQYTPQQLRCAGV